MATGNSKGGLAHRNKSVPKKTGAKSLKRKRGQEDLGKLKAAIDELVSWLFCLGLLLLWS
jgi:ATP-dependent RNA helicase DDX10/DBP4